MATRKCVRPVDASRRHRAWLSPNEGLPVRSSGTLFSGRKGCCESIGWQSFGRSNGRHYRTTNDAEPPTSAARPWEISCYLTPVSPPCINVIRRLGADCLAILSRATAPGRKPRRTHAGANVIHQPQNTADRLGLLYPAKGALSRIRNVKMVIARESEKARRALGNQT